MQDKSAATATTKHDANRQAASINSSGTSTVAPPYSSFARAYAASAEADFSIRMAEWVLRHVHSFFTTAPMHFVDIACGIGAAAAVFTTAGHRVTAVDASAAMLREARNTVPGHKVTWLCQDMRELDVLGPARVVTCMYDSLNFMLTPDELAGVFARVASMLDPGGFFIFDMYSLRGVAEEWGSRCEIHTATSDSFVVSVTDFDIEKSTNTKTLFGFQRVGKLWERWEERHTIRAYPVLTILQLLGAVGFATVETMGWNGTDAVPLTRESRRLLIVARRSSENQDD